MLGELMLNKVQNIYFSVLESISNRELALAIWLGIFVIWSIINSDQSKALRSLFSTLMSRYIIIPMSIIIAYSLLEIFTLYSIGLWNISQLKNTLYWLVGTAIFSMFKLDSIDRVPNSYKNYITDNFKISAIILFIISDVDFNFITEMIIVPISIIIVFANIYSSSNKKYLSVYQFTSKIILFFCVFLVAYAAYYFYLNGFQIFDKIIEYIVPVILTLLFLPMMFIFKTYSDYERLCNKVLFRKKNKETIRKIKKYYFKKAIFNSFYRKTLMQCITSCPTDSVADIMRLDDMIERQIHAKRKNGEWFPFDAMLWLKKWDLEIETYVPSYNGSFYGTKYLSNSIRYSIEGNEHYLISVRLSASIFGNDRNVNTLQTYINICADLLGCAMNRNFNAKIEKKIALIGKFKIKMDDYNLLITNESNKNNNLKTYIFEIRRIA